MTNTVETAVRKPVLLTFRDEKVVVHPDDDDKFMLRAKDAIEACKASVLKESGRRRFEEELLNPLHEWCTTREKAVYQCWLAQPAADHIPVFIVTNSERYDFAFRSDATDLDATFFTKGWPLCVRVLPKCDPDELMAYFEIPKAMLVYGELTGTPSEG